MPNATLDTISSSQAIARVENCPICTGSGFRKVYTEGRARYFDGRRYYDIDPCECQGERLQLLRWRRIKNLSQITDKMRNMTFETFNQKRDPVAYAAAMAFAAEPLGWLVFYGINGAGKTHLMASIAQHLIAQNRVALYCVAPDVLDKMRECFTESGRQVEERHTAVQILNRYKEADVLLLDDLGAERATDWSAEQFYKIFDHRYRMGLPTVVATNLQRQEIYNLNFRLEDRLFDAVEAMTVEMRATKSYRNVPKKAREMALAEQKAVK